MHCKYQTIKTLVTLALIKSWFKSLVFGHEHIPKVLRNKINFLVNEKNAYPTISIYEKKLILEFS